MPGPPLGVAPVIVDAADEAGAYYIGVGNLPRKTQFQTLKDAAKAICDVDSVEVYPLGKHAKAKEGWIRVRGYRNYDAIINALEKGDIKVGDAKTPKRAITLTETNKDKTMKVQMQLGAFRPTKNTPYFPGTEPEEYTAASGQAGSSTAGQQEVWVNVKDIPAPGGQRYLAQQGTSTPTSKGASSSARTGYYDRNLNADQESYRYEYGSMYDPGVGTSAYTASEASASAQLATERGVPTCSLLVRNLPGREGQISREAVRELMKKSMPENVELEDSDIVFPTEADGKPVNFVYIRFKSIVDATAAMERVDGQWLKIGSKMKKAKVDFAEDSEIPMPKKSKKKKKKEKDEGKGEGKGKGKDIEPAPLVARGSFPLETGKSGSSSKSGNQAPAGPALYTQTQPPAVALGGYNTSRSNTFQSETQSYKQQYYGQQRQSSQYQPSQYQPSQYQLPQYQLPQYRGQGYSDQHYPAPYQGGQYPRQPYQDQLCSEQQYQQHLACRGGNPAVAGGSYGEPAQQPQELPQQQPLQQPVEFNPPTGPKAMREAKRGGREGEGSGGRGRK